MNAIGVDIGTTKLCALALDGATGAVLQVLHAGAPQLPPRHPGEALQDADAIAEETARMVSALEEAHGPVAAVGLCGAMHGIVWLDSAGNAAGPLHTWQDQTAALPAPGGGESWAQRLGRLAGAPVPPGYGLATAYAQRQLGRVPPGAVTLATISDYAAMRLARAPLPILHPTNAASLGLFNLERRQFRTAALEQAGLDPSILPTIASDTEPVGVTAHGAPVFPAIGDNQASFAGAVQSTAGSLLLNVGTGSQLSLVGNTPVGLPEAGPPGLPGLETRPFFGGRYLYAGATLCGGEAYAMVERFFRQVLELAGCPAQGSLYPQINALLAGSLPVEDPLAVRPTFLGTRQDPALRGAIGNIGPHNLTPAHLAAGVLQGMAGELYGMVQGAGPAAARPTLVAAGNGVRKNPALVRILAQTFGTAPRLPAQREEAARGAALYALAGAGHYPHIDAAMAALNHFED